MIPRKLQLKNFLSYGDTLQTIDFSSHSLICFSGKNGHGKSALLDAITWALWGQARKVSGASKPDEGLLRLGQSKMLVSFEFELTGRVFRVRREFFKTYSRPITALDLEVHDLGSDKFVSLTEKTMRQTQAKLEDLLKIDFSTFSNSSFLRQGSADEFSKKTPRERKQVLAKILGIDRFDQYHQTAMEQVRSLQQEGATMQALRERIADEVEKQPELEIKLGEYLAKLDELGLQGQVAEKNVWLLERKKNKFDVVLQEITLVSSERDELKTRFIECAGQWRRHHVQILSIPCGKSLERELKKVAAKDAELRKKQTLKNELDRKAIDIEKAEQQRLLTFRQELDVKLNQQRQDLEKERTHVATFSSQFEAICAESTRIAQRIEALEKQVADGAKDEAEGKKLGLELVEVRAQFEKRRSFYQVLVQKGNWFSKLKSELDHKQGAVCRDNNPCCPLCEQMLSAKRKRFLGAQVANELNHCKHCLERIKHLIPRLKKILFDQHESLNLLQKKVAQYEQKAGRLVEVANECQRLLQEQKMCETKKKKAEALFNQEEEKVKNSEKYLVVLLKHVQKAIETDKELCQMRQELKEVQKSREQNIYDEAEHKDIVKTLEVLQHKRDQASHVEKLRLDQARRRQELLHIREQIKKLNEKLKKLSPECDDAGDDVETCNVKTCDVLTLESDLAKARQNLSLLIKERERLLQEKATVRSELQRIEKLKGELVGLDKKLNFLAEESADFQHLAQAFGKNGIQALLIENAVPEIEDEANRLLSRLTDNQAQVFIESQRDMKKGGVRESLDIKISDTSGIRPYEMFSGGEAFRIDFSLRIAVSKLLARRAGAALQTLIIDEGFGSQDEEGLSRLMDALYIVREDFSKVIVVSHLPALKDRFPVHFTVTKGPLGSYVTVEERG